MRDYRIWGVLLRWAVGAAWLFLAFPQVTASSAYLNRDFTTAVQDMARANPFHFYQQFLDALVLPHANIFAYLTLVGNAVVGLCLLLGLLTPYAASLGIILNVNYALASGWLDRANYPLNGLLMVCEIALIALEAGKTAGVDALFAGEAPRRRSRRF
jgi:thiosulfate dehydrogenase [quinone] large subunit